MAICTLQITKLSRVTNRWRLCYDDRALSKPTALALELPSLQLRCQPVR